MVQIRRAQEERIATSRKVWTDTCPQPRLSPVRCTDHRTTRLIAFRSSASFLDTACIVILGPLARIQSFFGSLFSQYFDDTFHGASSLGLDALAAWASTRVRSSLSATIRSGKSISWYYSTMLANLALLWQERHPRCSTCPTRPLSTFQCSSF